MQTQKYYIKGMNCPSCELIIEKKLLEMDGVDFVEASRTKGSVNIRYNNIKPSIDYLNDIFKENGYVFSEKPFKKNVGLVEMLPSVVVALGLILVFLTLDKLGLSSLVNINSDSSLPAFLVLGLIAGVSSCAALIGGLILSLSKQWSELESPSFMGKSEPHVLFNLGRLLSYGIFGYILGYIGNNLQFSPLVSSTLLIIVSVVMVLLALQMLGIRFFNLALPKRFTRKISGSSTPTGKRFSPFGIGFLTIFLPCGFTLLVEGIAVLSGSPLKGLFIMAFFVLGTAIPLFFIGLLSAKLLNSNWSDRFLRVAGILILFFVVYNLNVQFNFINIKPLFNSSSSSRTGNIGNNVQEIKTVYNSGKDISPSTFEVKKGIPVRLTVEVNDDAYGCMSTIMIPGLYDAPQLLRKGRNIIMEFTPKKAGDYQITCAMGVPRGTLKVTE